MTRQKYITLILTLGSLTTLGPFTIDMYLPGFPVIAKYLNTSTANVALSLSSFFIGISVGQLIYGPLLDRFGRKKPLYVGLTIYILASLGCAMAESIDALIALRFLQAIGSCAAAVTSMAMVRDLFPVKDSPKIFALLMLVVATSPMLAPTIGSYVIGAWGWQSVFVILMAMGFGVMMAARFLLPNTYVPDTSLSLRPVSLLKNYWNVLKKPQFFTYAFTGGIAFSGLFTYVAGSPMVVMEIFGQTEEVYGWIFAGLSVSFIGSSQINSIALRRYSSEQLARAALTMQSVVGILFLLFTVMGWIELYGTIAFLFAFLACLGFTSPNTAGLALAPFSRNAGSASALMGATQMGLGALVSLLVGLFEVKSMVPMVAVMACTSTLALSTLLIGRQFIHKPVVADTDAAAGLAH